MSVFDGLVGQDRVVGVLTEAVAAARDAVAGGPGAGMTHAWLFTGPPGSGRSVAARAFGAALQCPNGGCGACHECRTAMVGSHADVEIVTPSGLSYSVAETRALVARCALAPTRGSWQVTIVEDADRFTEQALNALLKALEEPPPRGVWLLCAPSAEDLLPTIRSRCRVVTLRVPPYDAVAAYLASEGIDSRVAGFAARAAQGHIGMARRLATDPEAAARRRAVLTVPTQVASVGGCFAAAAALVEAAKAEAAAVSESLDAGEKAALRESYGDTGEKGMAKPRGVAGAISELEKRQRSRRSRRPRASHRSRASGGRPSRGRGGWEARGSTRARPSDDRPAPRPRQRRTRSAWRRSPCPYRRCGPRRRLGGPRRPPGRTRGCRR